MLYFFVANVFTGFFLLGLIWIIQIIHYPGFRFADKTTFSVFAAWHQKRISWIVVPMMVIELVTSIVLCFFGQWIYYCNLALVLLNLIITFIVQVPLHKMLLKGMDKQTIDKLVAGNWIRTALWSLRALLLIFLLI